MRGCNIFMCHKSYVGWHVGSQWHSSHNATIWWPDLNVQLQLLALCYQAIQLSWHHHDVFEHLTAHFFLSQRHFFFNPQFLVLSVISIFSCLVRSVKYKSYDRDRNWTLNLLIGILALYPLSYGGCRSSESFTYIWTFGFFVNSC